MQRFLDTIKSNPWRISLMALGAGMLLYFSPEVRIAFEAFGPIALALTLILTGFLGDKLFYNLKLPSKIPPILIQLLLLITGLALIGLWYFDLSEKSSIASAITVLVGGILLLLMGVMDPATIKSLKLPGGGELERHTPSAEEKKRTEELFRQDELPWERLNDNENYKQLLSAAKERTNAQRSAGDYFILSTESRKTKEYDEALKFAHWGLIVETKDRRIQAALTTRIGGIYHELKLIEFANKHFLDAIGIDPYFAPPHNGLGIMYDKQENHNDAEKEYKEAIRLDSSFAPPHNNLGSIYESQGRYAEAEKEYNLAIQLNPKFALPHNGLGVLYHVQGNKAQDKEAKREFYAKAKAKYSEALKINPDFKEARENLEILQGLTGP